MRLGPEALLQRVERARPDVAVDDPERPQHQAPLAAGVVLPGSPRGLSGRLGAIGGHVVASFAPTGRRRQPSRLLGLPGG